MLIGRDAELAQAEAALAGRHGPRLVALVGDAGIGKTRLAAELAQRAGSRRVLRGRAAPLAAPMPLGLFQDAVRLAPAARAFGDPLATGFPQRLLPELGGDGAAADRGVLFEMASRWALTLAGRRGLLLVLEDLHLADATSLALVTHLAARLCDAPASLLVTYRPEDHQTLAEFRRELIRSRLGEEIVLQPLAPSGVEAIATELLGRPPAPETLARWTRLAGGNPFIVEELVRGGEEVPELPWSLRAMIAARLGRLRAPDRELLRWAAVLGERFDVGLLADAAQRRLAALALALSRLRDGGLLVDDAGERMAFRHALTHEAVAAELVGPERRRRHARVLAVEAGRLAPEEVLSHALAAGDRRRAFAAALAAGRRARELGGAPEAEGHYRLALDLWSDADGTAARAECLCVAGTLAARGRHDPQAVDLLEEARDLLTDPAQAAQAAATALEARRDRGEPGVADALAALPPTAATLTALARVRAIEGDAAGSVNAAEAGLRALGRPDSGLLNSLGVARYDLGDVDGGRRALRASAAAAVDSYDLARAHLDLGFLLLLDAGADLACAAEAGREGLAIAERRGLPALATLCHALLGLVGLEAGRAEEFERALAGAEAAAGCEPWCALLRGRHALWHGEFDAAEALLTPLLARAALLSSLAREGVALARMAGGDRAGARAALDPWIAVLRADPLWHHRAHRATLLAVECAGDRAEAAELAALQAGPRAAAGAALAGGGEIETAARALDARGRAWESARLRLAAAELAQDATLAEAALAAWRACGNLVWAGRTERLLRRLGRPVPSRRRGTTNSGLSARELEVLERLVAGDTNRAIAERLYISEPTAATHIARIYRKLGVRGRVEATRAALTRQLVTDLVS